MLRLRDFSICVCLLVTLSSSVTAYKYGHTHTGIFSISYETSRWWYGMTADTVRGACKKSNAVIASYEQMKAAWKNGFEECNCGYLSNNKAYYPIYSQPALKGCGNYKPHIRQCTGRTKWNGYCFAKKQCYKKFYNTLSSGGTLIPAHVAKDLESCKTFCTADKACSGFNYDPSTEKCWKLVGVKPQMVSFGYEQYLKTACDVKYDVGKKYGGVFHLQLANHPRYALTFEEAKIGCRKYGATLATYKQLEVAWRVHKMDMCRCGYLSDEITRFPITTTFNSGCGGTTPGIRSCGRKSRSDAYCFGLEKSEYTIGTEVGNVFHLERTGLRYHFTLGEAKAACEAQGSTLATYQQLEGAYKLGMDVCRCGWISDGTGRYPITKSLSAGCGGSYPGIRYCWKNDHSKFDAYCYKTLYSVGRPLGGVFHMDVYGKPRYSLTFREAESACKKFGATLASPKELETAWRIYRKDVCRCGFLSNGAVEYPITYTLKGGCGGEVPGIRSCGNKASADAYCYVGAVINDPLPPATKDALVTKTEPKTSCSQDSCLDGQTCTNTANSYLCTCPNEMNFNTYSKKCEEMDEIPGASVMGCYTDEPKRDLDGAYKKFDDVLSPFTCMEYCKERRYLYAGVQAGAWCMCGNVFGGYAKVKSSECDIPCVGDSKYNCGGIRKNYIYKTGYKACTQALCPDGRRCVDTDNGYWCSCKKGFVYNDQDMKCEDFSPKRIDSFYVDAFAAIRSADYASIRNFAVKIAPIYMDTGRYCQQEKDEKACELLDVLSAMKIQSGLVSQYSQRTGRYVVDDEFRGINLKEYINELQTKSIAANLLFDVSKSINTVLEQNQEGFKDVGEHFKEVANFGVAVANADKDSLSARLRNVRISSKTIRQKIMDSLPTIINGALLGAGLELTQKIVALGLKVKTAVTNAIMVLPKPINFNEIADKIDEVTQAARKIQKLRNMMARLGTLSKAASELGQKFAENKGKLQLLNELITPDGDVNTDEATVQKFVDMYGNFNGAVTVADFTKFSWEIRIVLKVSCDLMKGFLIKLPEHLAKCLDLEKNDLVSSLESTYQDIYNFEFELVKIYSRIVRGNIARAYSSRIGSDGGRINMYKLMQGIIGDEVVKQKAATLHCSFLEFQNGGVRNKACEKYFFSEDDINVIVSLSTRLNRGDYITRYAQIPTSKVAGTPGTINLAAVLSGKTIRFSVPRDNVDWLLKNGFITLADDLKESVFYILSIEPYLPDLKCASIARFNIRASDRTSLFVAAASSTFIVDRRNYGWEYSTKPLCAADDSYLVPQNGSNKLRYCSKMETLRAGQEIFPALFSEYLELSLQILSNECTQAEIDDAVKKTTALPIRIRFKTQPIPGIGPDGSSELNHCWPNPCANGGVCTNDYEAMTFKCECKSGATGKTCSIIPNYCAKIKCSGGTCVNEINGGKCHCGNFQHYDSVRQRCVPSNCKSMEGTCGSTATCVDTNTGVDCKCTNGQLFYAQIMSCRDDWCKSKPCGSAICTNTPERASCSCDDGLSYDPRTKSCINYCPAGACPSDSTCKVAYNGINPYKDCVCKPSGGNPRIYWREKNLCQFDWCKYVGEGHIGCGQERCRSDWLKEVCLCNAPQKFVASRKKCETQSCWTKGWPQFCGNYYPVCKNEGNQVCSSWVGGCWGSSRQIRCCNFCS